jgi:hypothetical protein
MKTGVLVNLAQFRSALRAVLPHAANPKDEAPLTNPAPQSPAAEADFSPVLLARFLKSAAACGMPLSVFPSQPRVWLVRCGAQFVGIICPQPRDSDTDSEAEKIRTRWVNYLHESTEVGVF